RDAERIRKIGLQLIAGQGRGGGWNYHCEPLDPGRERQLLAVLRGQLRPPAPTAFQANLLAAAPPDRALDLPVFAFQPDKGVVPPATGHEDNSLTQFALLALWAVRKHGIPVERSLAFAAARFRSSQN